MLIAAGKLALPDDRALDPRAFWFGCIGVRNDGAAVSSKNGSIQNLFSLGLNPEDKTMQKICDYHAEGRVLKKMTRGGVLYVSRVSRQTGCLSLARPCSRCRAKIRSFRIDKVFYTISNDSWGCWDPIGDPDGKEDQTFR